jgi:hypothetical protein
VQGALHCSLHLPVRLRIDAAHLLHPGIPQYEDLLYCNDGDRVENCATLLEDTGGQRSPLGDISRREAHSAMLFVAD